MLGSGGRVINQLINLMEEEIKEEETSEEEDTTEKRQKNRTNPFLVG